MHASLLQIMNALVFARVRDVYIASHPKPQTLNPEPPTFNPETFGRNPKKP